MPGNLLRFCCLLAICFTTLWAQCVPKNDTKGYPLPEMDIESFQTHIEFSDLDSRTTSSIREWYQSAGDGAGRIDIQSSRYNQPISYIFSYKTNETFLISGSTGGQTCKVLSLNTSIDLLVGNIVDKSGPRIASFAATLKFSLRYGLEFMGIENIRGIDAEKWRSCLYLKEKDANVIVDYYWSARNWTTPINTQVPLRADVHGVYNDMYNSTIDEHYEFIDFVPTLVDDTRTLFQTPPGVLCEGRKFVKPIPQLPNILKYTQEIIQKNPGSGMVQLSYNKIYYDYSLKLMRYDFHEYTAKPPLYNIGTVMLVHDFNTGVAYFVNKMGGNCTVRPIGQDLFDVKVKPGAKVPGFYQIEMRTPNEYFRIDDKYTYEGQRIIRGDIPVDVYIAKRTNYKPPGWENDGRNFTFEYFVLDPNSISINVGGVQVAQNIPLQLKVATYNAPGDLIDPGFEYHETTNFYNMDLSDGQGDIDEPQPSSFDIQSCYASNQKKHVRITFTGPPYSIINKEPSEFIRQVIKSIIDGTGGMSPLRIQDPQLDYDEKYVYFTATLLDIAPYQAQFVKTMADKYWVSDARRSYTNIQSSDDCLRNCSLTSSFVCNSTAYCPSTKTCVLSGGRMPVPDTNNQNTGCEINFRPVVDTIGPEYSLAAILDMLDVDQFVNLINVTLELYDSTKVSYLATDIRTNIYRPPGGTRSDLGGPYVEKFTITTNSGMPSDKTVPGIQSADQCAKQCLDSLQPINCLSFTYCYDIGDCMLTVETPDTIPNAVTPRARCDLFTRNTLSQFNHLPGKSLVRAATDKLITAESDVECANRCFIDNVCLSFDLCPTAIDGRSTYFCYMSRRHSTDSSGGDLKDIDNCDHYSKIFSNDFTKTSYVTNPIFPSTMKVYKGTNTNLCARNCVDLHGNLCRGYYTCDDICGILMVDDSMLVSGPDKEREDKNVICDYMNRAFYPDGTTYIPRRLPSPGVPLDRFDLQKDTLMDADQSVDNVVSAESCSRLCLERTPTCIAFSYCVDTGGCLLSTKDDSSSSKISQPRCDLYMRNSLSTYKEIAGKSLIEQSGPGQIVTSISTCANECDSQGDKCRSFDACPFTANGAKDKFYCYYTDKHFNTNGGDMRNSQCTHYSKSFRSDFAVRNILSNPTFPTSMVKYVDATEDRCAQSCVEYHGVGCRGYNYCNLTSTCVIQMITDSLVNSGPNADPMVTCTFMDRTFFQDGSPYSARVAQITINSGMKSADAAGLGIGMLLLGAVLCLGIVCAAFYYRQRKAAASHYQQHQDN